VDDYKFFALFIYLTDVEGGAQGDEHDFIRQTQNQDAVAKLLGGDQ